MTSDESSGQESSGTDLEITVCANGVVNVHRPESDRAHSVFVGENGDVVRCSCKGHHYRGECAHADAIERRPLVTTSAQAAASAPKRVATDGGRVETDGDESDLPAIEAVERFDDGTPRYCRCEGCGASGPSTAGIDTDLGDAVILHDRECPRADRDESDDDERGTVDVHGCSTCSGYAYGDDDQCAECQQRGRSPVNETPL